MSAYRITNKAQSDLISIGRFTVKEWGLAQRDFYLKQLDTYFSQIAENPDLGMACDFIVRSRIGPGLGLKYGRKKQYNIASPIRLCLLYR